MVVFIMYKCGVKTSSFENSEWFNWFWLAHASAQVHLSDSRFKVQLFFFLVFFYQNLFFWEKKEMTSPNSRTAFVKIKIKPVIKAHILKIKVPTKCLLPARSIKECFCHIAAMTNQQLNWNIYQCCGSNISYLVRTDYDKQQCTYSILPKALYHLENLYNFANLTSLSNYTMGVFWGDGG